MAPRASRRQLFLFLVAIVVPSLLLISVSLQIISQEKELAENRRVEERQRQIEEIGQRLFLRLERIRNTEANDPAVAFVGQVEGTRLVLPWERHPGSEEFRKLSAEAPYAAKVQEGEREELIDRRYARAFEIYNEALKLARHPAQKAYTRILVARALIKANRSPEAERQYQEVLKAPSDLVDDHGIPLALYAAERLVEMKRHSDLVLSRIGSELETARWLGPAESYMLRTIIDGLPQDSATASLKEKIGVHLALLERALNLQSEFANLVLVHSSGRDAADNEPIWFSHGDPAWLVGITVPSRNSSRVVAVKTASVLDSRIQLTKSGESLGDSFPGLRVTFNEEMQADQPGSLQQTFYFISLALVLTITLFGAYLLWRDMKREVRMADIRSQFVSSVTHELKTPLTAIRAFAETLQLRRTDDQTRDEYLETIVNESERLTRLLNNVLDFSKIERGHKMYRLEPSSLSRIVETAARAMHYPLAQQGFELRVDIADDIPPIPVDCDAIEQAILNLLTNAMKYSGESRQIDLCLRSEGSVAVIQVSDRGIGIDGKEQRRIFEKFYRVPTPENKLIPGTGLGLALVQHIAKAHGGSVGVKSAPGEGSTFTIQLPIGASA